ncbi:MAG: hypothetical protein IPJ84_10125 [Bdellovibrionales bacterium]|nr:hypothetical protein [Bdellovibrionales bacterium]
MKWVLAAGTRDTCRSKTENTLRRGRETPRGTREADGGPSIESAFGAVDFADVATLTLLDSCPNTERGRSHALEHAVAMAGLIR